MNTVARILLVFIGLLLIGSALSLLVINYNLIAGLPLTLPAWAGETVMLTVSAVLLLVALILLSLGLRSSRRVGTAPLKGSEVGKVLISINALENMVLRVLQQIQGIKDAGRQVITTKDGLVIRVRIRVMPDVSLPGLVTELQTKIKEYIEEVTGITVREVKIIVDNIIVDQSVSKK